MKIATRRLLPLELLLSIMMFSWGLTGWFEKGLLWKTLQQSDVNTEFGLALCAIALAQFVVCAIEWGRGRRWDGAKLLASVRARYWLAFFSVVVWVYVIYLLGSLRGPVYALAVQAPAAIVFLAWIYAENLKTSYLLDPKVPTERLQREIIADRENILGGH